MGTVKPELLSILRCPTSGEELSLEGTHLVSSQAQYPVLAGGIPCLYPQPRKKMLEWGSKIKHFSELERAHLKQLQHLSSAQSSSLTRQRLNQQHKARAKNLGRIEALLNSWVPDKALPLQQDSQQIYSYFQLFFRDWCWGAELQTYTDFALSRIEALASKGSQRLSVLILGSGAGGLSCALANAVPGAQFYSVEHNPMLAIGSALLAQGETMELVDYSLYPNSIDNVAQTWTIEGKVIEQDNHTFIIGEYPQLPFAQQQFDVVIAPWFFDIIQQPFQQAIVHCTRYLKDDGQLLFMGPANVHSPYYEEQLCSDEILECLQKAFNEIDSTIENLPYLDSPINSQNRREAVLFVQANKPKRGIEQSLSTADDSIALRVSPELQQYTLRLTTTLQVLSLVDEDMSAAALASKLESEFGFSEHESLHYAEVFIAQINSEL